MITTELFKLISFKTKDETEYQLNLAQIKLLLKHSAEYQELKLPALAIEYTQTNKYANKIGTIEVEEFHSLLAAAVEAGKLEVVQLLIKEKINVNHCQGIKPLFVAARKNDIKIAEFLIETGAEVDYHDPKKISATALHTACRFNSYEVTKCLLLNNANLELTNVDQKTPSHFAKQQCATVLQSAGLLKKAMHELETEGKIFAASSSFYAALELDPSFIVAYLVKMVAETNLRGQNSEKHNEKYYHPYLLRIAIKGLKTLIKTLPDFVADQFPHGFPDLIEQLNGYDFTSEAFDKAELIFTTADEKSKTLKWFEKGSSLESTKSRMKERAFVSLRQLDINKNSKEEATDNLETNSPQTNLISSSGSPIFTTVKKPSPEDKSNSAALNTEITTDRNGNGLG